MQFIACLIRLSVALALFLASAHAAAWPVYALIYSSQGSDSFEFDWYSRQAAIDNAWPAAFRDARGQPEPFPLPDGWTPNLVALADETVYVNIGNYDNNELDRVMGATRGQVRIFVPPGLHQEFLRNLALWPFWTYERNGCCCFLWLCVRPPLSLTRRADAHFSRAMVMYGYQADALRLRRPERRTDAIGSFGGFQPFVLGMRERAALATRAEMVLQQTMLTNGFDAAFAPQGRRMGALEASTQSRAFTSMILRRARFAEGLGPVVAVIISFLAPRDIAAAFGPLVEVQVMLDRRQARNHARARAQVIPAPRTPPAALGRHVPDWRDGEVDDDGAPLLARPASPVMRRSGIGSLLSGGSP